MAHPTHAVQAQCPDDILAIIPYLLGFHPEDSLVFVLVRDGHVALTARLDLDGDTDCAVAAERFAYLAARHEAEALILVAYTPDPRLAADALDELLTRLTDFDVLDALHADGVRWRSRLCVDATCCPDTGTRYDVASAEVAAEAVVAGLPALGSRAELVRRAAGPDRELKSIMEQAYEETIGELADLDGEGRRTRLVRAVEAFCARARTLTPTECAELSFLVNDLEVRDVACLYLTAENAPRHVDLWTQVVRHTLPPFEMAPLCLLGMAAWVSGNGALQVVCIERGLHINPEYSLLRLLEDINFRALPPSAWEDLRAAA